MTSAILAWLRMIHSCNLTKMIWRYPFIITSGYRDPSHSIEARKAKPGTHAQGIAADIKINNGNEAYEIIKHAQSMGFNGIGVAKTFIHVDTRPGMPVIWCY